MLFNSVEFIFYFLPAVVVLFYIFPSPYRVFVLLGGSLFFYSWWDLAYTPLLVTSILANFVLGRAIGNCLEAGQGLLAATSAVLGVVFNLATLGFFKYRYFLVDALGMGDAAASTTELILPLAISFFTFQQIAFLVDSWRGQVGRVSLVRYAAFVSFFPQLIAGPIVRQHELLPQMNRLGRGKIILCLLIGVSVFFVGLFKKVIVADSLAGLASPVFDAAMAGRGPSISDAWIATIAYHFQIYFDFSGYSTMAIGLGLIFGIQLPINFRAPYKAGTIIEFWRLWHMTLSRFLRDYLYIPLGGNRRGNLSRYKNLMVTMLLGGLWHGADWGFVLWGGLHGCFLAINHGWNRVVGKNKLPYLVGASLTFFAVLLAWVPFRTEGLEPALSFYKAMFDLGCLSEFSESVWLREFERVIPPIVMAAFVAWLFPTTEQVFGLDVTERRAVIPLTWSITSWWAVASATVFIIAVIGIIAVGQGREFLYFQF